MSHPLDQYSKSGPRADEVTKEFQPHASNMTLRDYFAAKSLQALRSRWDHAVLSPSGVANEAYKDADAMLKERAK